MRHPILAAVFVLPAVSSPAGAQDAPDAAPLASLQAEVAELRAEAEIRELLHAYGRAIDTRDFDGFAQLWTVDAAYLGGANSGPLTGGPAIASFMEGVFADNPSGLGEPNAHVFFNEFIDVEGDRATGTSMGAFVTTAATGPVISIIAHYDDEYVLEDGRWKFARRVVQGFSNTP
jgi:uncharacterized protein (TIGR02246 family)